MSSNPFLDAVQGDTQPTTNQNNGANPFLDAVRPTINKKSPQYILGNKIVELTAQGQDTSHQEKSYKSIFGKDFEPSDIYQTIGTPKKSVLEKVSGSVDKVMQSTSNALFGNTAKLVGGTGIRVGDAIAARSKDLAEMNKSNENLNSIDQQAIQKARQFIQNGELEKARRLLEVVKSHGGNITLEDILHEPSKASIKQAAGEAIGAAGELASLASGAGAVSKVSKANGVLSKVVTGAKAGAKTGAIYGGVMGASEAMQENKGVGDVVIEGVKGAVGGGAAGGVLGGVAAGTTAALNNKVKDAIEIFKNPARRAERKALQETLEITMPELSKAEKATAIAQGRGSEQGALKLANISANNRDIEVAQTVKNIINPTEGYIPNIQKIRSEISNEADAVIQSLKNNDAIFNKNQLRVKIKMGDKPLSLQADDKLNKMYDLAENKFMDFVEKNPKNLSGLLQARKQFDSWVDKEVPKIWEDTTSKPLHNALRQMRSNANDFIAEKLPAGNQFKESLKRQSLMYDAIDNMSDKAAKEIGTNAPQRFMKKHPGLKKALQYGGAATVGATAAGFGRELLSN